MKKFAPGSNPNTVTAMQRPTRNQSFLQDDNVVHMDWLWSDAIGGIKLVVRQKDAEESEKLLTATPGNADEKDDTLKQDS